MKHTRRRYTPWIWMMVSLLSLTTLPLHAQQTADQNQRVKLLETLKEADAALDSMRFIYVMTKIETLFGISVPEKKWVKLQTLGDAINAVEEELAKKK